MNSGLLLSFTLWKTLGTQVWVYHVRQHRLMRQKRLKRQLSSQDMASETSVWDVFHGKRLSLRIHSPLLPYRNSSGQKYLQFR